MVFKECHLGNRALYLWNKNIFEYAQIVVTNGNSKIPNIEDRLLPKTFSIFLA